MKINKIVALFSILIAPLALSSCNGKGGGSSTSSSSEPYIGTDPATILDGYYKDLKSWDNYLDLKHQLYDIVRKNYTPISYTKDPEDKSRANWSTNRNADQSLVNFDKVHLLYSDSEEFKQTGNTSSWQREHCFPASLATGLSTGDAVKTLGTATDFHNLYASYSSANSAHSNMSYGYVRDEYGEIKNVGNARYTEDDATTPDINEGVFEPADIDKGRCARAVLYMGLMYGNDSWVEDSVTVGTTTYPLSVGLQIIRKGTGQCTLHLASEGRKCHSNLEEMVEWNNNFWPDQLEYQHTSYVQTLQHNRNPFVDFPELVDYVYGDKRLEGGELIHLHNIYDNLKLGSDEVCNIAVKNAKYAYDGGETFTSSKDVEVYTTSYSRKVNKTSEYQVSGINDNSVLNSEQNGQEITISYNEKIKTSYNIYVNSEIWQTLNYKPTVTRGLISRLKADNDVTAKLDGYEWSFHTAAAKTTTVLDLNCKEIGLTVGSNSTPADTFVIKTTSPIKIGTKDIIKKIYLEANSASYWDSGFHIKIKLGSNVVYDEDATYDKNRLLVTHGIDIPKAKQISGNIEIELSEIKNRLNFGRIGILLDSAD